jgi:catalase
VLTPEQTVDGINRRFGAHAGVRALHAKGTVTKGTFTATPAAAKLTRAVHMQGEPVEATVRFSNGSGDPRSRDWEPDVRGMAVSFHLPGGDRADISAQTVPHFPVTDHDSFVELVRASEPGAAALWRFPLFLAKHPKALTTLRKNAPGLKPPTSYATRRYYAIHAFKWVAADGGERYVRYSWVPEAGEESMGVKAARGRGNEYLQEELRERLASAPIRFTLQLQLANEGDAVDDPTADWGSDRELVDAGTLEVTALDESGADRHVYDPMRLTDGIEPSQDPILNFRPKAYSVSADRRMSAG